MVKSRLTTIRRDDPPKEKVVTKSTTDPDSGVFRKGEYKRCFAYCAQTVCDSHNFILGVTVNQGNMHDSVAFDAVYNQVTSRFPQIKVVTADAGYKTPWICKRYSTMNGFRPCRISGL